MMAPPGLVEAVQAVMDGIARNTTGDTDPSVEAVLEDQQEGADIIPIHAQSIIMIHHNSTCITTTMHTMPMVISNHNIIPDMITQFNSTAEPRKGWPEDFSDILKMKQLWTPKVV